MCIEHLQNGVYVLRKAPFFSCSSIVLNLKCKYSFLAHSRGVATRSSSRSFPIHTILWSVSMFCWHFWNALLVDVDFTSSFILWSCMENVVAQTGQKLEEFVSELFFFTLKSTVPLRSGFVNLRAPWFTWTFYFPLLKMRRKKIPLFYGKIPGDFHYLD